MREDSLDEGLRLRWLERAMEDLRWAEDLAQRGAYYLACFLAQQVVEKASKAFLYARGVRGDLCHSTNNWFDSNAPTTPG